MFGAIDPKLTFEQIWPHFQAALNGAEQPNHYWVLTSDDIYSGRYTGTIKIKAIPVAGSAAAAAGDWGMLASDDMSDDDETSKDACAERQAEKMRLLTKIRAKPDINQHIAYGSDGVVAIRAQSIKKFILPYEECFTNPGRIKFADGAQSELREFVIFLAMYPPREGVQYRFAVDLYGLRNVRMTLPRIRGTTLNHAVMTADLNRRRLLLISNACRAICLELQRLHALGVTHYSIHIENIVGMGEQWCLIDFGSAQFQDDMVADLTDLAGALLEHCEGSATLRDIVDGLDRNSIENSVQRLDVWCFNRLHDFVVPDFTDLLGIETKMYQAGTWP